MIVVGVGVSIIENATTSRLAVCMRASRAPLLVLLLAGNAIVMIVDVVVLHVVSIVAVVALIVALAAAAAATAAAAAATAAAFAAVRRIVVDVVLEMALGLVLDVLGVLRTFFPSVLARLVQLAIALVGTEEL